MLTFELNNPIDISLCKCVKNTNAIIGIYKITSPTGKINIGQTTNVEFRFAANYKTNKCKSQKKLYHSFKKYGVKNHTFEIIHICKEHELNYWEDYYIKFFDTFNTPHGLNLKEGGSKGKMSDESKRRMSESQKKLYLNGYISHLNGNFLNYDEAKKWVNKNSLTKNIKTQIKWFKITKKLPSFIPHNPEQYYRKKGDWKGFGDFLGTGNKVKGNFLSYVKAKKWIQKNILTKNINTQKKWKEITNKLPDFIPKDPKGYYERTGVWNGWGDFLDTGNVRFGIFLSYNDCKKWVQKNKLTKNIKSNREWNNVKKVLPLFIPKDPYGLYKRNNEWVSWGDFLNTGNKFKGDYLSYKNAKKWIQKNELTKKIIYSTQWRKFKKDKLPEFIPKAPNIVFKNKGWEGWSKFLNNC